jgi:hypothetical protein
MNYSDNSFNRELLNHYGGMFMNIRILVLIVSLFALAGTIAFAADPLSEDEIKDVALQDIAGEVQQIAKVDENNRELWKVEIKDEKGEMHTLYYDDEGIRATK